MRKLPEVGALELDNEDDMTLQSSVLILFNCRSPPSLYLTLDFANTVPLHKIYSLETFSF